jgi:hypothetical protein
MKAFVKKTAMAGALVASAMLAGGSLAQAQTTINISPIGVPQTGATPTKPNNANESYDSTVTEQLMKLVELSRVLGGGITQMLGATLDQKNFLQALQDAETGVKVFPLNNSQQDISDRAGGQGLLDMAEEALSGGLTAPDGVVASLDDLKKKYSLDGAFKMQNDPFLGKKLLAQRSAVAAIGGSTAEETYKRANASNARLDGYITSLQNSADLKTSVDINTRVLIELTQQTNDGLRNQAAIASIISASMMSDAGLMAEPSWIDEFAKKYPPFGTKP